MDNQPENQVMDEDIVAPQKFSVGAVLREAREQQGMSVADVANRIKFAPRQIEAMEADDYAQLPEATFVRGFVRSYARLLEIDAAPLLAALPQTHLQAAPVVEKKSVEVPFPSALAARRANIMWFAGALLVGLVLFILSRMHDSVTTTSTQPLTKGNVETIELALPTASAPVADAVEQVPVAVAAAPAINSQEKHAVVAKVQPQAPAAIAAAKPLTVSAASDKPQVKLADKPLAIKPPVEKPKVDDLAASNPAKVKKPTAVQSQELVGPPVPPVRKPAAQATPAAAAAAAPASAAADTQIAVRMSFDADSWVEVKDGTGRLMLSKMNTAGSLVRMSGVAPITISIGQVKGVHVFYKGREINLAPHTNGDKARLVVEK